MGVFEVRDSPLAAYVRGGRYQVFSVRYDTEYFTFDTVDTILFSIPILNKGESSIHGKHVDNIRIHTHTYTQINYSKVLVQEHVNMSKNMFSGEEDLATTAVTTRWHH